MASRADELIATLRLRPHPEGGFYTETFRSTLSVSPSDSRGSRAALTTIYFLLTAGQRSRLHRVTSDEGWHFCEGDPLELTIVDAQFSRRDRLVVGPLTVGARPVHVVPAGMWQGARPVGEYSLVSCCVGPGFDFDDFRLLAPDIRPIAAVETRALRQMVLRPHQRAEELVFDGDEDPETLHVGAYHEGLMLGVASVSRSEMPGGLGDGPSRWGSRDVWKLRGLAVRPGAQGEGIGRTLLERCLEHVTARGGRLLWCNGRTSARAFYERLGFHTVGQEFTVPHTGPHYVFVRGPA